MNKQPLDFLTNFALAANTLQPTLELQNNSSIQLTPLQLQVRARQALDLFLADESSNLLTIASNFANDYTQQVYSYVQQYSGQTNYQNFRYTQVDDQHFSLDKIDITQHSDFKPTHTVICPNDFDYAGLFGAVIQNQQQIILRSGLLHQVNHGIIILPLEKLLANAEIWQRLKAILLSNNYSWQSQHPYYPITAIIPDLPMQLKVILMADFDGLALFDEFDPEFMHLTEYVEMHDAFLLEQNTSENQALWCAYIQDLAKQANLKNLDFSGLNSIYRIAVRDSENIQALSLNPTSLTKLLKLANTLAQQQQAEQITKEHIIKADQTLFYQTNLLQEYSYQDIQNNMLHIVTSGAQIGQINGLSVVEYSCSPVKYGIPTRISCIVNYGDGEIIDVEKRSDLSGSIHTKGLMVAEACLTNQLSIPTQLPFSASIVFEQSYSNIDGDSASLAEYCVLISALAEVGLSQSIAVTGAIDQFGNVLAVGGIADKIEGFFQICKMRGLTGEQGVIIPAVHSQHLSLSDELVEMVQIGKFNIYAVNKAEQAIEILTEYPFNSSEHDESLANKIKLKLEKGLENKQQKLANFFHWFKK